MTDTAETMVERVTRAIDEATFGNLTADRCKAIARAAIAAMAEPTEAMIDAAFDAQDHPSLDPYLCACENPGFAFRAMIQAALTEPNA